MTCGYILSLDLRSAFKLVFTEKVMVAEFKDLKKVRESSQFFCLNCEKLIIYPFFPSLKWQTWNERPQEPPYIDTFILSSWIFFLFSCKYTGLKREQNFSAVGHEWVNDILYGLYKNMSLEMQSLIL